MLPLARLIKDIQEKMQDLFSDLQELSIRVCTLEEDNAKLRRELARFYHQEEQEPDEPALEADVGQGLKNLVELYNQGFHICNLSFGQARVNECLFCQALLNKSGAEK
ncbi:initiation control protein YabA [Desulfolucanica intricata]|uniref:initiation control protein YabA n=1 Tax=Desulfolucanica intricata TaxID=1285191 RepID=UPI000837703B|nr:initiation control protein YabA [Desulfolucanica intricata]